MEENALTGMSTVIDSTIAMVVATDRDDPTAQLHYFITAGNELGIFDIPNPAVSCPPHLNSTYVLLKQYNIGVNMMLSLPYRVVQSQW